MNKILENITASLVIGEHVKAYLLNWHLTKYKHIYTCFFNRLGYLLVLILCTEYMIVIAPRVIEFKVDFLQNISTKELFFLLNILSFLLCKVWIHFYIDIIFWTLYFTINNTFFVYGCTWFIKCLVLTFFVIIKQLESLQFALIILMTMKILT